MNLFSDVAITFDHMRGENIYHGKQCLWCSLGRKQTNSNTKVTNYPTSHDLRLNGTNIKKKGLFIGINYSGTDAELAGAENDARNLSSFMMESFHFQDVKIILGQDATKENILNGIKWLLEGVEAGDLLFFHYSGHGSQVGDASQDEQDGHDEVIVPVDYEQHGYIVDDILFSDLISQVPTGVGLINVIDACHSGTMVDLPRVFVSENNVILGQYSQAFVKGNIVCISASKDNQTASDVRVNGNAYGALTNMLISCIRKRNLRSSLSTILKDLTLALSQDGFSQKPTISTSNSISLPKYYFSLSI